MNYIIIFASGAEAMGLLVDGPGEQKGHQPQSARAERERAIVCLFTQCDLMSKKC